MNNHSGNGYTINFNANDSAQLGARTLISGYNVTNSTDLGGSSNTPGQVIVPGPLPLVGVGAAFQASRRLRRRLKNA